MKPGFHVASILRSVLTAPFTACLASVAVSVSARDKTDKPAKASHKNKTVDVRTWNPPADCVWSVRTRRFTLLTLIVATLSSALLALTAFAANVNDAQGAKPRISIVSPSEKQTVHANSGRVPVAVNIDDSGSLRYDIVLRVVLDGKDFGPLRHARSFDLENVVRGEHRLQVQLIDESGNAVASSEPITFYLWQASRLF